MTKYRGRIGPLRPLKRQSHKAVFAGGYYPTSVFMAEIEGLSVAAEVSHLLTGSLSATNSYLGAGNNSQTALIVGGWNVGGCLDLVDKLRLSVETIAASTSLLVATHSPGCGTSLMAHYGLGGGTPNPISDAVRLDFSTEALSTLATCLPSPRSRAGGASTATKALLLAGEGPASSLLADIVRFEFATETALTAAGGLSAARCHPTTITGEQSAYACAGLTAFWSSATNGIDKCDYASETASLLSATTSQSIGRAGGSSTRQFGVMWGGVTTGNTAVDTVEKLAWSTDTTALSTQTCSTPRGVSSQGIQV